MNELVQKSYGRDYFKVLRTSYALRNSLREEEARHGRFLLANFKHAIFEARISLLLNRQYGLEL